MNKAPIEALELKEMHMSEQERHKHEQSVDDAGSTEAIEEETPDVEAHRLEIPRNDLGTEPDERERNEGV